jgi:hypothetical protein
MDFQRHPDIVNINVMAQKHKKHIFHLRRVGLLGVLVLAFFIVRADASQLPGGLRSSQVLAYATEMSRSGLLSGTNAARAANGLGGLALNSQLNNAAQAKAQHMADNNYWAHVAPDGTQPWYFFTQAGYNYIRAGENLAYGFMSSQGAIDGWMNSPSHRANIVGNYNDVGFGIVNTPNYQSSGEQTIVVAHYGALSDPAPPPAPAAPVASTPPPVAPQTLPTAAPTSEPETAQPTSETPTPASDNTPATEQTQDTPAAPVQVGQLSRVSVLSMIASKTLPLAALVSLVIVSIAVVGYALTHRVAFQHAVHTGEHFVVAHPGIDTTIVAIATTLILLTTYGNLA